MEIPGTVLTKPNFEGLIKTAEYDVNVLKKKDAETKIKNIKDLLIEYILANMANDSGKMKDINTQISSLIQQESKDIGSANDLLEKLKEIKSDPKLRTPSELKNLQNLVTQLEKDIKSGNVGDFERLNSGFDT